MALRREPTAGGPIAELFDRLHELHFRAGEPGMRQIAAGLGAGVMSHTTVHNLFRGPKVPRWGRLELVVEQLDGDVEVFKQLWQAARRMEISSSDSGTSSVDLEQPTKLRRRVRKSKEGIPDALDRLAQLEARASTIFAYAPLVIPGLLQTPEYAAAIFAATPTPEQHLARPRMEMRMVRQAILGRLPPPKLDVIIEEGVLQRPVGGHGVMRRQVVRLLELAQRPQTTIRVLLTAVGAHPGLSGQFTVLEIPDDHRIRALVFRDGLEGGGLDNDSKDVDLYRQCFTALQEMALDPKSSSEAMVAAADKHLE